MSLVDLTKHPIDVASRKCMTARSTNPVNEHGRRAYVSRGFSPSSATTGRNA